MVRCNRPLPTQTGSKVSLWSQLTTGAFGTDSFDNLQVYEALIGTVGYGIVSASTSIQSTIATNVPVRSGAFVQEHLYDAFTLG